VHGYGGFAEYVSVPVDVISLKLATLSFDEAAAVPMAGVTALRALRHHGEIQESSRCTVNQSGEDGLKGLISQRCRRDSPQSKGTQAA
jgi:NADPH:quinone reductase-like Zn-dependent oxidoreductase